MHDFESLKLLVALLGPSCPLLGPIWSQNGPQNGPKSGPKSVQNLIQKLDPKITPKIPVLDPKMVPEMGSKLPRDIGPSHLGHPSGARWPQDGPKMVQDAFWRGFGGGLEGVWRPPNPLQNPSKPPPNPLQTSSPHSTSSKPPPKPPDASKMSQDVPKMAQDGAKMLPRCPKMPRKMPSPSLPRRLRMAPMASFLLSRAGGMRGAIELIKIVFLERRRHEH